MDGRMGAAFLLGLDALVVLAVGGVALCDSLTGQGLFGIWLLVVTLPASVLLARLEVPPGEPVVLAQVGAGLAEGRARLSVPAAAHWAQVTTSMRPRAGAVERRRRRVAGTVGGWLALVLVPGQRYAPDQLEAAAVEGHAGRSRAGRPGAWL